MSTSNISRPDDRLADSSFAALRHIFRELLLCRGHISTKFGQEFRGQYHGTALGVTWNIVLPIAPLILYSVLAHNRVIPVFENVDPSVYVAAGATIWFFLSGCVQQPLQIVRARNAEVMKTALPLSAMVVSGFGQLVFETIVRSAFVGLLMLYTGTMPTLQALLVPVLLVPATMFFLGIGLMLGIANLIFGDVGRVTGIILQYGIFLSGIIFPITALPISHILGWNPFYIFVDEAGRLMFLGEPDNVARLLGFCGASLLLFMHGCRVFYIMEYRVRSIT